MNPKDIENPIAEEDFRHQAKREELIEKIHEIIHLELGGYETIHINEQPYRVVQLHPILKSTIEKISGLLADFVLSPEKERSIDWDELGEKIWEWVQNITSPPTLNELQCFLKHQPEFQQPKELTEHTFTLEQFVEAFKKEDIHYTEAYLIKILERA